MSNDPFWNTIDTQLDRIENEQPDTFDGVRAILAPVYDRGGIYGTDTTNKPDAAFFGGSGGDRSLYSALLVAGWRRIWGHGSYYYVARHAVTGETLTYIEGDMLRGDQVSA